MTFFKHMKLKGHTGDNISEMYEGKVSRAWHSQHTIPLFFFRWCHLLGQAHANYEKQTCTKEEGRGGQNEMNA